VPSGCSVRIFWHEYGLVAAAAAVRVAAHVAVRVPHVVAVFLVERVFSDELERRAPEDEAFLETEPDAFEEERVLLQPAVMLKVAVFPECRVEVFYAEWEGL
jgi:hypothetical protein